MALTRSRTRPLVAALAAGPRPIPPLPHPSWEYGRERPRAAKPTAREFWDKLGG